MLQELVRAYASHMGVGEEYLADIVESDGVFTFAIEGENICTISEERGEEDGKYKISVIAALNIGSSEEALLELIDDYSDRLRYTPLYQKALINITDDLSVGLSCAIASENIDAPAFCKIMDLFVATVRYVVSPEVDEEDKSEADAAMDAILDQLFVPVPDKDYRQLLLSCGFDEKALNNNFGIIYGDDGFAAHLSFHNLSGLLILDNSFACDQAKVALDLIYVNGLGPYDASFEYTGGAVHLVSYLDPRGASQEDFSKLFLTHHFLVDSAQEYINNEDRHVEKFDVTEIMNALLV